MKASETFGALIRALGIYLLCGAISDGVMIVLKCLNVPTGSSYPIAADWVGGIERLCVGLILLAGADLIVRLIYRQNSVTE
jgi:hypothetical protein